MAAGVVIVYISQLGTPMLTHERVTLESVAKAIAQLKHSEFGGCRNDAHQYSRDTYFVPTTR